MSKSSGRIWPYAIGISITMVFGFCVATIMVTSSANIQESDAYMTHYQEADAKANEFIESRIAFDKKYNIEYLGGALIKENGELSYRVSDKSQNAIDDAQIILVVSRPETAAFNQEFKNPEVKDGVYTFKGVNFPKDGVWNLMAKVNVGSESRFLNMKADTRIKEAFEF